jgi:hypothetical protein
MSTDEHIKTRPNLSVLALISFMASFIVARLFSILHSNIVLIHGGIHFHHFWYGLSLLVIGGWLGISISCDHERINRVSAIIFGVGGGLVGDEVGLLLTFGDYWSGITYTLVIIFSTVISLLILLIKYSKIIHREFTVFLSSHAGLYSGVFLVVASVAFILETRKFAIRTFPAALTIVGCIIIGAYFIKRMRRS